MKANKDCIAIYSRKSKYTGKGESICNQIELCKRYIETHYGISSLEHIIIYEDEGFSGGNLNRPDFRNMMLAAEAHQFHTIIVYRLDRISRNISDFSNLIEILSHLHIDFISIKEQFDTSTPTGRAMMYISSIFSQLERETIAERIRDNMQELAKTGRWLGGTTPTGYTSEAVKSITPDGKAKTICYLKLLPEEADIIRTIYHLYLEFDSQTLTEAELIKREIRTKNQKYFSRFSIKAILQNPVYAIADQDMYFYFTSKQANLFSDKTDFDGIHGIMAYNRTLQKKGKTTISCPIKDWIISVGHHQGVIPGCLWIKVQESLERNKIKSYRKPRKNEALLTGLLLCSCGSPMYPKLGTKKTSDGIPIHTYSCQMKARSKRSVCNQKNLEGNLADQAILKHLLFLPYEKECFLKYLQNNRMFYMEPSNFSSKQLLLLKTKQLELKKKIDDYINALVYLNQNTIQSHIIHRIEEMKLEYSTLESNIQELNTFDSKIDFYPSFFTIAAHMSLEGKKSFLRSIIKKIIWDGKHLHVFLWGEDSK